MTGDQQWPVYEPGEPPRTLAERTVEGSGEERPVLRRRSPWLAVVVATCVLVGAGAAAIALLDQDPSDPPAVGVDREPDVVPVDRPAEPVDEKPDVLSGEGYQDLVDALQESTGSSDVFDASLHDGFAYLRVPVDGTSQRETRYSWDGDLEDTGPKGTSDQERIDLADIDPELLVTLLRRVSKLVEDPATTYVLINGRPTDPFFDDGVRIMAYASNEYAETAYLATRVDGTLVRRVVSTED